VVSSYLTVGGAVIPTGQYLVTFSRGTPARCFLVPILQLSHEISIDGKKQKPPTVGEWRLVRRNMGRCISIIRGKNQLTVNSAEPRY
jgi:hypothetical protein